MIPLILIMNSPMGDKAAEGPGDYSPSGGAWVPADLNYGHLDGFFFLLAALMCCNTYVLTWLSHGYEYMDDEALRLAEKKN